MSSLAQNNTSVKSVMVESVRLTKMSIQAFMSGKISKAQMEAYQKRITGQLIHFWWNSEVETAYTTIERQLTCPDCHGTGVRRIVNGFDAGEIFVPTSDEYVPCHCDHDGEQDVEIGG